MVECIVIPCHHFVLILSSSLNQEPGLSFAYFQTGNEVLREQQGMG